MQPTALALLAVVALVLGGVGGVVGWAVAGGADRLVDPGASLTPVSPGRERPPGSVADVAGRVAPAVVSLELQAGSSGGTGSGVVLSPDGYIVTNNHVVELAATDPRATLEAVFASGLRAPARVVGRDPQTDVAVVKVELANPVVAQLGRSSDLQVGDGVIAIGSPLGLAGTVTEGIVSSVDRPVRLDAESAEANPVIDAIQTDAAINPGNSGGALVDTSGAVVGINTAIRTLGGGEGGSIGLGFAIPIDDVRVIAESIIRTGGYTHSDLGVNAKSVTDGASDGAQVLNVRPGWTRVARRAAGGRRGPARGRPPDRVGRRARRRRARAPAGPGDHPRRRAAGPSAVAAGHALGGGMFDNIGWPELLVLALVGLFVLGPERLPAAAAWVANTVRTVRDYATGARDQLRSELGPEFEDLRKPLEDLRSVRDLNPRRAVRQHLFTDPPVDGTWSGSTAPGAPGHPFRAGRPAGRGRRSGGPSRRGPPPRAGRDRPAGPRRDLTGRVASGASWRSSRG